MDWDIARNLYTGDDNLDMLKLLRETCAGWVKLIHTDSKMHHWIRFNGYSLRSVAWVFGMSVWEKGVSP